MLRVDRYIIKIGSFGTIFYDQDTQRELTLDEVVALLNNRNELGSTLTVSSSIPFEPIESDGMPLLPILEAQDTEKKIPTIEGSQLIGLGFR